MNISITPELEKFIQAKVKSGMYQSASELVRDALRLLAERDELRRKQLEKLDRDIQLGLDQAQRGELLPEEESKARLSNFKRKFQHAGS
jgi:antitoxin ParD1/3/4